jgi:hypothetical protein
MGCFHGQAIGDCLACDIDDTMRDVDPGASRDRLTVKATALIAERDALIQSCKAGDEVIARLEGEKEAMMRSGDRAYQAVKELRADLAAERARTHALVESLPKCDNHPDRPATRAWRRGAERWCDECALDPSRWRGSYAAHEYPRAAPLRAILKARR